jgi:hypothetical protein
MLCYGSPMTRAPASSAMVSSWLEPLVHLMDQITSYAFLHITEQDPQPVAALISKEAIPYRTCGGTCCPRMSTPKTQSLADSSMTNHISWRNPTVSIIPTHAETTTAIHNMVTSHHDVWKTNTQQ